MKRCDSVGKTLIEEVKGANTLNKLNAYFGNLVKLNDLICRKHVKEMNRNIDSNLNTNSLNIDYNNNVSNNVHSDLTEAIEASNIFEDCNNADDNIQSETELYTNELAGHDNVAPKNIHKNTVTVNIPRCAASHDRCCVCKRSSGNYFI